MGNFFHTILSQPLLNALIGIHNILPGNDIGWAIIVLTVLVRIVLYPAFRKQIVAQRQLQSLQPKIDEIKKQHKGDKEAENKAILEFYQTNKINPLSSCLPLLVQLPILFALYRVFLAGLGGDVTADLYPFISDPGQINSVFLGVVDLSSKSLVLALLAGAFQFVQSKMIVPTKSGGTNSTADMMNKQMIYFMPVVTVFISYSLPAGLALYWVVTTLFAIGQQYYIMRTTAEE